MHTNRVLFQIVIAATTLMSATSCDIDIAESTENNIQPKNVSGNYSFSISGGSEGSDTRAILDGGVYYWQQNDQVGLSIVEKGKTTPIIANNITLKSDQDNDKSTHTTFSGNLTPEQINNLTSDKTYDYYSYFPKTVGAIGTLPNLSFTIPSSITLTPDVFNPNYAPMAAVNTGKRPIVYLDGENLVCPDDLVHFEYKHILSYAAIEMDVRLLAGNVTSITLTNNADRPICGEYSYDMSSDDEDDEITPVGSNSITIIITGGLTVGDGKVLYVPMPPVNMSEDIFTLTFTSSSSTNKYESVTNVYGANFKRGQIHHLKVAPVVKYTTDEIFTVSKTGYYFIEAWGGDGGAGGKGSNGLGDPDGGDKGVGIRQEGLYYFYKGDELYVQVGTAGSNGTHNGEALGTDHNAGGTGGFAGVGKWFGNGYRGGDGGKGHNLGWVSYTGGGAGGGGGAASGVLKDGTLSSNIVIASGGGGGGGGGSKEENGANGGNSNTRGSNTLSGASYGPGGSNWSSSYTDGYAHGNGFPHKGNDGSGGRGRGGAGGGGGGWNGNNGGGGQSGGSPKNTSTGKAAGGGGAGGNSSNGSTAIENPDFTLPFNSRPSNRPDGYVVITFIRE